MDSMSVEITVNPPLTSSLRHQLVSVWVDVTDAGGAVGFIPPTTAAEIQPVADAMFRAIERGAQHLVVAGDNGTLAGWFVLEINPMPLTRHWAWFRRVMVSPSFQGRGIGRDLTAAALALGSQLRLEQLYLTCRSESGLREFYSGLGWQEVGRMSRNLRLADSSYRDEIYMVYELIRPARSLSDGFS
jgi:GNAT superfamily N-acetyltransferase